MQPPGIACTKRQGLERVWVRKKDRIVVYGREGARKRTGHFSHRLQNMGIVPRAMGAIVASVGREKKLCKLALFPFTTILPYAISSDVTSPFRASIRELI